MQVLRFTKRYQRYNAGETAGFADETAASILRMGVAVLNASVAGKAVPPTQGHDRANEERRKRAAAEGGKRNRKR